MILQREVAERLCASPGQRAYGSMAVLHALTVDVSRSMRLEPRCFYPVPRVQSSFLTMRPLARPLVAADELESVERVARAAFSQRRKTLANALRGGTLKPTPTAAAIQRALARLEVSPRIRAERLVPAQMVDLTRALAAES